MAGHLSPSIIYLDPSCRPMQLKSKPLYSRAWLTLIPRQLFIPVLILDRSNQYRTLIIDEGNLLDPTLAYYVDDHKLLPRNSTTIVRDLLHLQSINYPEVRAVLAGRDPDDPMPLGGRSFVHVGANVLVDTEPQSSDLEAKREELEKYYRNSVQLFLANPKQRVKSIILLPSGKSATRHQYAAPLFSFLAAGHEYWCHRAKIQRLGHILQLLLPQVHCQIRVTYSNHQSNVKESKKVRTIGIKPYLPSRPPPTMTVPTQMLELACNPKFMAMYRGPQLREHPLSIMNMQRVVDAMLGLGVEVKEIHTLMRLLSVIVNLHCARVEQIEDNSYRLYDTNSGPSEVSGGLEGSRSNRKQKNQQNLDQLLDLSEGRLVDLLVKGQDTSGGNKTYKQREMEARMSCLGDRLHIANFRAQVLKYVLYEMFILQTVELLNRRLTPRAADREDHDSSFSKQLLVFSYAGQRNPEEAPYQQQQAESIQSLFWANARTALSARFARLFKLSLVPAIMGSSQALGSSWPESIESPSKQALNNKGGQQSEHQVEIKDELNLQALLNQLIQKEQEGSIDKESLVKQLGLLTLCRQVSFFGFISEVSLKLFDNVCKPALISEIPYTVHNFVWPNHLRIQKRLLEFKVHSAIITSNRIIDEDPEEFQWLIEVIRRRKVFLEKDEQAEAGFEIEVNMKDFAQRYLYTEFFKHQLNGLEGHSTGGRMSKSDKIASSLPFPSLQKCLEGEMQKLQKHIHAKKPAELQLVATGSFRRQNYSIKIKHRQRFQQLQKQLQLQRFKLKSIQRQYRTYCTRNRVLKNVSLICRNIRAIKRVQAICDCAGLKAGFAGLWAHYELKLAEELEKMDQKRLRKETGAGNLVKAVAKTKASDDYQLVKASYARIVGIVQEFRRSEARKRELQDLEAKKKEFQEAKKGSNSSQKQEKPRQAAIKDKTMQLSGKKQESSDKEKKKIEQVNNKGPQQKAQFILCPELRAQETNPNPKKQQKQSKTQQNQEKNRIDQPPKQPLKKEQQNKEKGPDVIVSAPTKPQTDLAQKQPPQQKLQAPKVNRKLALNVDMLDSPDSNCEQVPLQRSQNLEELTIDQLCEMQDHPSVTLEEWQRMSRLKFDKPTEFNKMLFTKYVANSEKKDIPSLHLEKPFPDLEIMELFMHEDYITYTRQNLNCHSSEQYTHMILNTIMPPLRPYFKEYPIDYYDEFYKDGFNAILKIGLQKKSTKKIHELLNVIIMPLSQTYYKEIKRSRGPNLFDQSEMVAEDYSSNYNVLKDEIFFYFVKQISSADPQNFPDKIHHAYLFGLSVFSRYFYPSPAFLYPLTHYIHFLYKQSIKKGGSSQYINLLESIFENLLLFIEAYEGFKGNPVRAFKIEDQTKRLRKTQAQCSGYLHPRKNPLTELEVNQPGKNQKPQPPQLTIWLLNNEAFNVPVRNEIVKSIKKKVLLQLQLIEYEQCFNLYFLEPDYSYTMIMDKEKASNLFNDMQLYQSRGRPRYIYLRITHYFPFSLKDLNKTRMVYLTMISDELTFPWIPDHYEFLVAQSMAYDDFEEARIGNYLHFTNQLTSKSPNMKPIEDKYRQVAPEASKKICEYEYMKHMKAVGYFLMKCFVCLDDKAYVIGVKPWELVFFKNSKLIASVSLKHVKNAFLSKGRIILEIYYLGKKQKQRNLRQYTILGTYATKELFQSISFHLKNRIPN